MTDPRTDLLRSMLPLSGRGLEIGPGYNPLLPKGEGFRIETADYTDAEGLRAKYRGNPHVNLSRIEPVDHVLQEGRPLAEVVGRPGAFDFIIASHVIEHTPDILGFLVSCETLLTPRGVLLLAVPDKRHCFDVLLPLASTGMVLQAHLDRRTRPAPGSVFDDVAYSAVRDGAIGWALGDARPLRFFSSLQAATEVYDSARFARQYHDVHVWRFVPSSFRLIVNDLFATGKLRLREDRFHDSVGNEFYMTMSVAAAGCPVDRLTLAKRALQEQAAIPLNGA
jgi:SAM-dependent methyltransferase